MSGTATTAQLHKTSRQTLIVSGCLLAQLYVHGFAAIVKPVERPKVRRRYIPRQVLCVIREDDPYQPTALHNGPLAGANGTGLAQRASDYSNGIGIPLDSELHQQSRVGVFRRRELAISAVVESIGIRRRSPPGLVELPHGVQQVRRVGMAQILMTRPLARATVIPPNYQRSIGQLKSSGGRRQRLNNVSGSSELFADAQVIQQATRHEDHRSTARRGRAGPRSKHSHPEPQHVIGESNNSRHLRPQDPTNALFLTLVVPHCLYAVAEAATSPGGGQ